VREPEPPTPSSTPAGTLLIAHPGLLDPNFHKTVLFISSWEPDEGAFGLVLNRAAGRTVSELLPGRDDLGALGALPVFLGGPVSRDQLIFAAFQWHAETGVLECRHHVSLSEAEELTHQPSSVVRAFIGYAGWGKGQLEAEIAQSAWLLKPAEREVLDLARSELVWRNLLASFGPKYRLISEAPDDPTRN
jgi:putative transcriptional regulator